MENRVWTLGELDILNEIHKPIAVIASGVYHSPHRWQQTGLLHLTTNDHSLTSLVGLCCSPGGLADVARVLFQNVDCHKRFGPPRSLGEYTVIMESLTEAERQARQGWLLKVVQVLIFYDLFGLSGCN